MSATPDFAEFYAATFKHVTAQLHAFTGDPAEAQDLAQEAYTRAFTRWAKISTFDDPVAWVRRVAWNLAVSRWRRARRLVGLRRELVPPPVAGPDGAHLDLIRALATLPPDQRRAIVLYYLADMSVPEIAVFCEVAEGTVKAWLHRARTKLNQVLGDEEVANA